MHLEHLAYGRVWECDRRAGIASWCAGVVRIENRKQLTELQIAEAIARRCSDSAESAGQRTKYRRLSGALRELEHSPYLSDTERKALAEAASTVERLARAAELATDRAKRQEKAAEAERETRYGEAEGLLGRTYAFDPNRLEATVIDLLALDRYSNEGQLIEPESVERFEARLRRRAAAEQSPLDVLLRGLAADHQHLRAAIARSWSWRSEPVQDLHTRLAEQVPGLREAILASSPVLLQGVRRLLAASESANVVPLPVRQSS
jgi:hypothetical protein